MTTHDKLNELNQAEEPAKELLRRLGYLYMSREVLAAERDNEREVLLKGRLKAALLRLNPWMAQEHAERAIFNLENIDAVGMARNQAVHEYLTYGMPLDVDEPGGRRTRTVQFFDFDHPLPEGGRNEFIVTTQFRVRRGNEPSGHGTEDDERVVKPDLVLFVNGIPLVVMEAKSPSLLDVWKYRAVRQLRRYQEATPEWQGTGAPALFDYNLMCIAHCGADAAYAPIGGGENAYVGWKSLLPFTEDEVREKFAVEPKGQAQLIVGLLNPATLLEVLRDYVVFEPERGRLTKKLPRYQQYRTVTKALERMRTGAKPEERGGVVWHTQGSGKSLTMLWLATKLRRERRLRNPTIVIVTDRTQLDKQITETFRRSGFPAPEHADSTRDLRRLLSAHSGRTIMTTIQKFEDALATPDGQLDELNPSEDVVVMVDEAHRTQYGTLGAKMAKALPRAVFIGFTGTPIDKGFSRSTMRRFGPLIDAYTIPQSVADRVTVPIYYEARLPELTIQGPNTLDKLFDALFSDEPEEVLRQIRRRYANKETVAEAEQRIEMIALDIAEHFTKVIQPNGFKAQVVAPSRSAAVKYAERLTAFGLDAYPIITTDNNDGPEFKWAREVPQEQIIRAFVDPDGKPEVLVVVDMLLTGFDAPVEQVLYLDRALREHGLLQAIARVNRRFEHEHHGVHVEKDYGLVVDYHGVSHELEDALAIFEIEDTQEAWTKLEEDPGPVIEAAAVRAESYFKGRDLDDLWQCVAAFEADATTEGDFKADLFERFNADYRDFSSLMDRYLPNPLALPYVDRLARLTKVRAYVRAQNLRDQSDVDWDAVSAKVKHLIDSRIDAEVRELMRPVSILDKDFDAKVAALPHDEARASLMEHSIRAQIKERLEENPAFYERLSVQLERIIQEMRQRVIDAAEACTQMVGMRLVILSEADIAAQAGLSEVSFAIYELLEQATNGARLSAQADKGRTVREGQAPYRGSFDKRLTRVATKVELIIKDHQTIVDWEHRDDVQRAMRRDIKRELRAAGELTEEGLDELARTMVEIARRRNAR